MFGKAWRQMLKRYDKRKRIGWNWQSVDGSMKKKRKSRRLRTPRKVPLVVEAVCIRCRNEVKIKRYILRSKRQACLKCGGNIVEKRYAT